MPSAEGQAQEWICHGECNPGVTENGLPVHRLLSGLTAQGRVIYRPLPGHQPLSYEWNAARGGYVMIFMTIAGEGQVYGEQ